MGPFLKDSIEAPALIPFMKYVMRAIYCCERGSKQLQVQDADHPQEIERTEEEGRKAGCGFGEIGENCDFTSPRKRPS